MSSESVAELDESFESLLCAATAGLLGADPAALDDQTLHELIVGLQAERSRLAVAAADLIAEWDQRRLRGIGRVT